MARPNPPHKPIKARETIRLYMRAMRPYRGWVWLHVSAVALANFAQNIAVPYMLSKGIGKLPAYLANPEAVFWTTFGSIIIGYVIAQAAQWILWRLSAVAVIIIENGVMRDLEQQVFSHLSTFSYAFFANTFGGALVNQSNRFVGSFERLYDSLIYDILPLIVRVAFSFIIIFGFAPSIALGLLAFTVLFLASAMFLFAKKLPYSAAAASARTRVTARLADSLTNVSAIKYFARESDEVNVFHKVTGELFRHNVKAWTLQELIFAWQATLMVSFETFVFILSLGLVASRRIDLGQLVLIQAFIWAIFGALWGVSRVARNIERSLADAVEMTDIMDSSPEVQDAPDAEAVTITGGSVKLTNLDFSYHDDRKKQPVFKGLTMDIKPGEKIGLVGTSGGGKTTVTKLLLRLMDIQGGTIELDGHDIAKMRQADVRRAISYVPQEPLLFHRTLRENIAYGRPGATQAQIADAARKAHAAEFIHRLPEGYDTLVGERGIKLSGGQRQRVAIARAMLKDAPILVLDEATSALDSESERLIQDALWRLMEGRTAIVIAHRLSTIQRMDRIIVLEDGQVVEQGTHHQLLERTGTYAKLWSHQSGGFIEE